MESDHRLTLEEIQERHPEPDRRAARRTRTSAGCSCARPSTARCRSARAAATALETGRVEGEDPLAPFSPTAPAHLLRTDGFAHVADIMVGSFYDPELEEGCAFEELICFHGGLGGPQTRPFLLYPPTLTPPPEPIIGAAAVHGVLRGWRNSLQAAHDARHSGRMMQRKPMWLVDVSIVSPWRAAGR